MMREIRRKDRILDEKRAMEILAAGEYGFLSMANIDGGGYGIPMSYIIHENSIYFHCAREGHKLENLTVDNRVTFTVIGRAKVIPKIFTFGYESAMVFGKIEYNLPHEERLTILHLFLKKYSPDAGINGEKYIKGLFDRTELLKMNIEVIRGKTKKIPDIL
jgi:hypothetical protein